MVKLALPFLAILLAGSALADPNRSPSTVDLRDAHALEQLKQTNPQHYQKIQQILAGLAEQPHRAETDWLRVNFDARAIDLSRVLIKTSNPPKQLLRFALDDVRYTMYVTRSDLIGTVVPAQ